MYQDVKDRLYHGHRKVANNTYLKLEPAYYEDEHITMTLHGNLVAMFHPEYLELYSAGRHSNTTKNRLNLALELAKMPIEWLYVANVEYPYWRKIYQHNWDWYYGNFYAFDATLGKLEPFTEGMRINYDGTVAV